MWEPPWWWYINCANDLWIKCPNWNTKFARNFCEVIARKGLKFLATFWLKAPTQNHWLIRKFPVITNFERYTEETFFGWEKTNEVILAKQGYKCFIWVTNLGAIQGKCCLIGSCLDGPSKLRHFSYVDLPANTTRNQPKPTKRLLQTSWFQTNFAVYLWQWHCIIIPSFFKKLVYMVG